MSGASEQANGQGSGPVLQSVFLVILAHIETQKSGASRDEGRNEEGKKEERMEREREEGDGGKGA